MSSDTADGPHAPSGKAPGAPSASDPQQAPVAGPAQAARRALPAHFLEKSHLTDTAGVPWKGRDYAPSPYPDDHGETPPQLDAACAAHARGDDPHRRALVAALATSRVLVPIMAVRAEETISAHGLTSDNGADMAMVSIRSPQGEAILPIFSSVKALAAWKQEARPVPVPAPQAAQAAVQEGCTSLLLDPGSRGERDAGLLLPRSVLWALAQGREWIPPHEDAELADALTAIAEDIPPLTALVARPGLHREVDLHVHLEPGLDAQALRATVQQISTRLAAEPLVADRISSLRLVLEG